jgi:hypothetical protein
VTRRYTNGNLRRYKRSVGKGAQRRRAEKIIRRINRKKRLPDG